MELQDLRCLTSVAQQFSFARAAEGLHVTQPTLPRRIRDVISVVRRRFKEDEKMRVEALSLF